jgi:single-strand DNA-binding protein
MYNKVFLIGRLTRDPETRVTSSGISVTRFSIAVDRIRAKNKEGVTDFLRVVAWRRLAEITGEYLNKGKLVAVEGRLQISSYEKDGVQRTMAEIVADNVQMLDRGQQAPSEAIEVASEA